MKKNQYSQKNAFTMFSLQFHIDFHFCFNGSDGLTANFKQILPTSSLFLLQLLSYRVSWITQTCTETQVRKRQNSSKPTTDHEMEALNDSALVQTALQKKITIK
jgi:hypothetical protein